MSVEWRKSQTMRKGRQEERPSWDDYFISIAGMVKERSTCLRRHVGAILVKERRILATGYNGAPTGFRHCAEVGCLREQQDVPPGERHELCRGIHAEQNAIVQAAAFGVSIRDSTLYCTHFPCSLCAKMIINAGIRRVVVARDYPDNLSKSLLEDAGIDVKVIP
jgi:dCMP deaminase